MAGSLPVLTFHDVDESKSVISFSPALFRRGLEKLYERGYRAITLREAVEAIRRGGPLPDRSFAITFDDGYDSVSQMAFPVLRSLSAPATVFITVGAKGAASGSDRLPSLNGRPMLAWSDILEMHRSGLIDIGAHTLTHPDLTRISIEQAESEVRDSKAIIEDAIGAQVDSFAYPFGRYNGEVKAIAGRYFKCACSDRLGLVSARSDIYALSRVDAYYLRREKLFGLLAGDLFPSYVLVRNIPRTIRRALTSG